MVLVKRNVLVLDRDFRPHRVIGWKRTMGHLYSKKIEVVSYYDNIESIYTPAVVRLIHRAIPPGKIKMRRNLLPRFVFARDNYMCQYCGSTKRMNLTIDHVIPKALGGLNTYENCTTACYECNQKKADKTLEDSGMILMSTPVAPFIGMMIPQYRIPDEWKLWLNK